MTGVTLARNVRYPLRTGTVVTASAAVARDGRPEERASLHGLDPLLDRPEIGIVGAGRVGTVLGAALHPAMTFSGTPSDLDRLPGTVFGVTALGRHWPIAERLVRSVGGSAVAVPEQLRPLWHAGLAHGANHLVTLVASALDVVRATG